jgi:octaprenyl-diphosphate synthase
LQFLERVKKELFEIEQAIEEHLSAHVPLAKEVSQYILKSGGKRLRPLLFVLSARLCGHCNGKEIRLSPIFEYIHIASLLHDDVIDKAKLRRGRPSANIVWGNTIPILAGDFLFSTALYLATSSDNLKMVSLLSEATKRLSQGEILEIVKTENLDLTEEEYLEIIAGKTATLMAAACRLGAVLACAPKESEEALHRYGYHIGLAFQIIDDVLDYVSYEETFGKPVGQDLKEGKNTLPLIYTLKRCSSKERQEIAGLFKKRTRKNISKIMKKVEAYDGLNYARNKAKEFIDTGKSALSLFPEGPNKKCLQEAAEFIIERQY